MACRAGKCAVRRSVFTERFFCGCRPFSRTGPFAAYLPRAAYCGAGLKERDGVMKRYVLFMCLVLPFAASSGCGRDTGVPGSAPGAAARSGLHDGYYSAEASAFDRDGWKRFVTLYTYNNRIVTAEFNARNASGLVMSWDVRYLGRLQQEMGLHPNQILREYIRDLLDRQSPDTVRAIGSDAYFHEPFTRLVAAALNQARSGDRRVVEVFLEKDAPAQP